MTLAFYAPLKPPTPNTPSGDPAIGRALLDALAFIGTDVTLASTLRSRDGRGSASDQTLILDAAATEATNLIRKGRAAGWRAWITYHNYYKAPDLLGPAVTTALGIPYLQVESTRAQKRLTGPWAQFAHAAEVASDAADVIFYLTKRDAFALERDAPDRQKLRHLAPFLPRTKAPSQSPCTGPILSVGMMRPGDKLSSYHLISETLTHLKTNDWHLRIAGDGPAWADVKALFAPFGDRVLFLGALDAEPLAQVYAQSALLLWPGVNEAFGLSYLEAQAHGLPVVAQNRPGVCDVLAPGAHPTPEEGTPALAQRLQRLLDSPQERITQGAAARSHVAENHLLPSAAETLRRGLADVGVAL